MRLRRTWETAADGAHWRLCFFYRCGRMRGQPPLPAWLPEHHRRLQVQLPAGLPPALPVEPVCRWAAPVLRRGVAAGSTQSRCLPSDQPAHWQPLCPPWNQREVEILEEKSMWWRMLWEKLGWTTLSLPWLQSAFLIPCTVSAPHWGYPQYLVP